MTNETDHPFQPGVEVAVISRPSFGRGVSYRLAKVARVYKSGKFVLEGSTKQLRPHLSPWGDKEWSASSSDYKVKVEFVTEALKAEVAAYELERRFRYAISGIVKVESDAARRATVAHCEALERILAELTEAGQ